MESPPILTTEEVLSFLQCKRRKLSSMIRKGVIVPLSYGHKYTFLAADVYGLIENRQTICPIRRRGVPK